jgi:hypothetical protein
MTTGDPGTPPPPGGTRGTAPPRPGALRPTTRNSVRNSPIALGAVVGRRWAPRRAGRCWRAARSHAVAGDRIQVREQDQLLLPLADLEVALAVRLLLLFRRGQDHAPARPSRISSSPSRTVSDRSPRLTTQGISSERARMELCEVRVPGVGGDPDHARVELRGDAGRQVAGHQHHLLAGGAGLQVRIGPQQAPQHARLHVGQVVQPVEHHGVRRCATTAPPTPAPATRRRAPP